MRGECGETMRVAKRQGQIQVPFHLIFALVGGVLFFLFFLVLIRSVIHASDTQNTQDLSFAVQTALLNALTTPNTFTVTDLRSADYAFVCQRDSKEFESYVRINGGDYDSQQLRYVPFFSPSLVKGDQLFTETTTWKAPFPIGSLLLVSNNRTRYVFVGAGDLDGLRSFIQSENLGGFNIKVVGTGAVSSFQDTGFDQYRFVYFITAHSPTLFPNSAFADATALVVHRDPDGKSGTLTFYDDLTLRAQGGAPQPTSPPIPFYGDAMLDAAIFSQDSESFACNFAKVEERLNSTIQLLERRIETLEADLSLPDTCTPYYETAHALLEAYADNPFAAMRGADSTIAKLVAQNRRLIATNGCPSIY